MSKKDIKASVIDPAKKYRKLFLDELKIAMTNLGIPTEDLVDAKSRSKVGKPTFVGANIIGTTRVNEREYHAFKKREYLIEDIHDFILRLNVPRQGLYGVQDISFRDNIVSDLLTGLRAIDCDYELKSGSIVVYNFGRTNVSGVINIFFLNDSIVISVNNAEIIERDNKSYVTVKENMSSNRIRYMDVYDKEKMLEVVTDTMRDIMVMGSHDIISTLDINPIPSMDFRTVHAVVQALKNWNNR